MRRYTAAALFAGLRDVGVEEGETVLVHSSLLTLGAMDGVDLEDSAAQVYAVLRSAVGKAGTIVVPTFTFAFCRGEPFDPVHSPSEGMGALSEHVRQLPDACRSRHPIQSIAAVGPLATLLCSRDTATAFSLGGPFDGLLEFDALVVLVGASMQSVSLVHVAEERVGVPYRDWKSFTGDYVLPWGVQTRSYRMYARDLDLNPRLHLGPVSERLAERGDLRRARVGSGWVQSFRARSFVDLAVEGLRDNPLWLLTSQALVEQM